MDILCNYTTWTLSALDLGMIPKQVALVLFLQPNALGYEMFGGSKLHFVTCQIIDASQSRPIKGGNGNNRKRTLALCTI